MMCGGPIIWGSSLQSTIALSSTESEYSALVNLGQEICYALGILRFLGISPHASLESGPSQPVEVFCDNTSTINIAENRFRMRRTRHVQVKCLKLQEWIQDKTIKLLKFRPPKTWPTGLPREAYSYKTLCTVATK